MFIDARDKVEPPSKRRKKQTAPSGRPLRRSTRLKQVANKKKEEAAKQNQNKKTTQAKSKGKSQAKRKGKSQAKSKPQAKSKTNSRGRRRTAAKTSEIKTTNVLLNEATDDDSTSHSANEDSEYKPSGDDNDNGGSRSASSSGSRNRNNGRSPRPRNNGSSYSGSKNDKITNANSGSNRTGNRNRNGSRSGSGNGNGNGNRTGSRSRSHRDDGGNGNDSRSRSRSHRNDGGNGCRSHRDDGGNRSHRNDGRNRSRSYRDGYRRHYRKHGHSRHYRGNSRHHRDGDSLDLQTIVKLLNGVHTVQNQILSSNVTPTKCDDKDNNTALPSPILPVQHSDDKKLDQDSNTGLPSPIVVVTNDKQNVGEFGPKDNQNVNDGPKDNGVPNDNQNVNDGPKDIGVPNDNQNVIDGSKDNGDDVADDDEDLKRDGFHEEDVSTPGNNISVSLSQQEAPSLQASLQEAPSLISNINNTFDPFITADQYRAAIDWIPNDGDLAMFIYHQSIKMLDLFDCIYTIPVFADLVITGAIEVAYYIGLHLTPSKSTRKVSPQFVELFKTKIFDASMYAMLILLNNLFFI